MRNDLHNRRHFLSQSGLGIGGVAAAWLLHQEGLLGAPIRPELEERHFDLAPKQPHHVPKAKAMISIFMQGGPSHHDLFDPKPVMEKMNGKPFPGTIKYDSTDQASSKIFASPWKFSKHGQCGTEISELLPCLAKAVDEITLVRSMHTGVNNHGQSISALNTGLITAGRPVWGSWLSYGLGTFNQSLPAYVVLTDSASLPVLGVSNFSNGWLPSLFQGTVVRAKEPRILNLDPPVHLKGKPQENLLGYLSGLNKSFSQGHPLETDLEARIASFELAARLQSAGREALDLSQETEETKKLYGFHIPQSAEYAARCLIARRLIERGVRFVQILSRNQMWDNHGAILSSLPSNCLAVDRPSAALVLDLKRRGLLDSTAVTWGGEMGRLPVIQNDTGREKIGRDHNTYGFSWWLAGGGFKKGHVHGATDDFGHHAVKDVVNHYDLLATLLHLFGLDPKKLTYQRNGQHMSLVENPSARVVKEILA
ncbi:MAG: DUF1501 domain-containing protein [Gemmataceae bacterium]|nr:DUF1501 domain-containing protein [Gemmataceae bacterium]